MDKQLVNNQKGFAPLLGLVVLAIVLPLLVLSVKVQLDNRSRAQMLLTQPCIGFRCPRPTITPLATVTPSPCSMRGGCPTPSLVPVRPSPTFCPRAGCLLPQ